MPADDVTLTSTGDFADGALTLLGSVDGGEFRALVPAERATDSRKSCDAVVEKTNGRSLTSRTGRSAAK